jgi:hypothetical protein
MQFWSVAAREHECGVHEGGCDILSFAINGEVHNLVTCATTGLSLVLLKSGGLRESHGFTAWSFGNVRICWKAEKSREIPLCSRAFGNSEFRPAV